MATYIYARISTDSQDSTAQAAFLASKYVHDYVVEEVFTGTTTDRPKLNALVGKLVSGDTLIVRETSRLGRNSIEVLTFAQAMKDKGVSLIIDNIGVNISTPAGEMVLTVMAGAAKMERELMLERQRIGIEKAKADGKYTGRKALDPVLVATAKELVAKGMKKPDVAKQLKMGLSTLYKYLEV